MDNITKSIRKLQVKGLDEQSLDKRKAQTLNQQDAAVIALGRKAKSSHSSCSYSHIWLLPWRQRGLEESRSFQCLEYGDSERKRKVATALSPQSLF